jgi:uncharacterized Zn finger protein
MAKKRWREYVPVGRRVAHAAEAIAALRKRGATMSPVVTADRGRAIAHTFWGKAWCTNLERYSDFANRLPRGRSYVRSGAVVDLTIGAGTVAALVRGSDLYTVRVRIATLPPARWRALCADCAGEIDSLIALLEGELSPSVAQRICSERTGLFPAPSDITFDCSCPDWASMCKHVAAVLYGIGVRLDAQSDLLFTLRGVAQKDLIEGSSRQLHDRVAIVPPHRLLAEGDLSELFGIEIATDAPKQRKRGK